MNTNHIHQQFGLLTTLPIVNYEESDVSSTPPRPFIDKPNIVSDLKTEFGGKNELNRICCINDDKI